MKDLKTVASYLATRYQAEYGEKIDEMKLQKLAYLAQRESLVRTDEPLFDAEIQGWRLGPVIPDLRTYYKEETLTEVKPEELSEDERAALDAVFNEYADRESLSLSRMTHGEICWRKSRKGIRPSESSNTTIPLEDIRLDALRLQGLRMLDDQV